MIEQLVQETLHTVPQRTREVVSRRCGITTGKVETLDKIGKNLKITRERVRQIEFAGRAVIRTALPKSFGKFSATVHDHLKHFDGVREEGRLLRELAYVLDEENVNSMHIKFLLSLDPSMMYVQETDSCAAFWTDAPKIADKVFACVKLIDKTFAKRTAPVPIENAESFFMDCAKKVGIKTLRPGIALSYACLRKMVTVSPFG